MTAKSTLKSITVIPGKRQRDPESSRVLGALAEGDALDSRLRGNDGSGMSMTAKSTLKSITVIPGKRQRDPESSRALRILPRLTLWIPAYAGMTIMGVLSATDSLRKRVPSFRARAAPPGIQAEGYASCRG